MEGTLCNKHWSAQQSWCRVCLSHEVGTQPLSAEIEGSKKFLLRKFQG